MEKTQTILKLKAICLSSEKGKAVYKDIEYDLANLKPNFVIIKMIYSAIGPFDTRVLNHLHKLPENQISFGFEGVGTITHVGKDVDSSIIGKKAAYMTPNSEINAFSEYSVIPYNNIYVLKEVDENIDKDRLKNACYLYGNPFTAKGLYVDVIEKEAIKSVIMDTSNSSLGKMIAKLLLRSGIKLINIVRNDEAIKTMESISKDFTNLNSTSDDFIDKLKEAISKNHPQMYLTFLGGNLPSRIFELMERLSSLVLLGNINNENLSGFSTAPLIFQEKRIFGYSVMNYFTYLQKSNKMNEVCEEILSDSCYETSFNKDAKEFCLKDFNEGVEYYNKNSSKGKIVFRPDSDN